MSAVAMIIFAFSGTPAFFPIAAEMKNPKHYTRSMLVCQATVTTVYLVIGVVVYYYCGSYVASPALGSAGPLMKKVCYGIALPGLFVTQMIVCHVSPIQPAVQENNAHTTNSCRPKCSLSACSVVRSTLLQTHSHIGQCGSCVLAESYLQHTSSQALSRNLTV